LKVPFSKPYFTDEDLDEILSKMRDVLASGWLTSGKNVEALEKTFAEMLGVKEAIALNSCTAGLHAILIAMGIKSGDEVIVPTNTFVATANAALYTGAKPVFADSDPDTFNISPEDVERKITSRTKAMIVVHLAGNPCDMKALSEIAADHHISLLEDCAHAHGARTLGRSCGTFGEAAAFSFYATKIITTGEGGIVTTDDEEIARRVRRIRTHGRGGVGPVETTELGFNYRMPDIQAVIGLSQIKHLSDFVTQRQETAQYYNRLVTESEQGTPQLVRDGDTCPYYVYIVKLSNAKMTRDELIRRLGEKGIGTSVLYYPVHTQPFYRDILRENAQCPIAEQLGRSTLALPMFNGMSSDQLHNVESAWRNACEPVVEQYASLN